MNKNINGTAEELDTAATGITVDTSKPEMADKYGTAEEEEVSADQLKAYEKFVDKCQTKFGLKSREEADAKAQELIKAVQQNKAINFIGMGDTIQSDIKNPGRGM